MIGELRWVDIMVMMVMSDVGVSKEEYWANNSQTRFVRTMYGAAPYKKYFSYFVIIKCMHLLSSRPIHRHAHD